MSICLTDFGIVCALGQSKQQVFERLIQGNTDGLVFDEDLPLARGQYVGRVNLTQNVSNTDTQELADETSKRLSEIDSRNNQLAYLAFCQIEETLLPLIKQYSQQRIAVVIGTSTSGISEGEQARKVLAQTGEFPENFHYKTQEMVAPAQFIANLCQAKGPVYSISTACSSSGKALVSGKALIEADLADVVIAGGVDSLAQLTVNGFQSLESIASERCQPFGENRDGINIGEAAALFVLHKDKQGIAILGAGECSDAYHISSPSPDGEGAARAMELALKEANIRGSELDYVNLHGTATAKNDDMEAKAIAKICGLDVLCGSTKAITGHTLGAAGALEIGFCWLLLSDYNKQNFIPANVCQQKTDPDLPPIRLSKGQQVKAVNYCLSNSFAFGGNNFSLVLGKV